ncbi:hypothetical protein DPMN_006711 [Dreissena polymorpha]|uniref:YqaJ viral recombinase domain-containing protein n=1 Tax=Dreissena polymorpha TaxID=45954 RepID=A0A9D4RV79_DREPO|nr:hypothetical protein DPMN_006711 [Dreissena polymorpha]
MNGEKIIVGNKVNLEREDRYVSIEKYKTRVNDESNPRLIAQRSHEWHAVRKEAKVTGSTLYGAIGCDGLAKQKEHFEKIICGIPEKEHSLEVKAAMKWGTDNEINAVSTIVGKILPVFEAGLKFYEEGCVRVNGDKGNVFIVVSPDGSLRKDDTFESTEVAIEIKCPTRHVHTELPSRYYLQCQTELKALDVRRMLYVSWTETDTTVFRMELNDDLLNKALKVAEDVYGSDNPKKPTRLGDAKQLKTELKKKSNEVKILGRVSSCQQMSLGENEYCEARFTSVDLISLLRELYQCTNKKYELLREKASEAVVFLLADLDRGWQKNAVRCSPIAWFPKGYSLDCETMRFIAEEVHTRCTQTGINVPCQSFDGQWHPLVVRSLDGQPLTAFQLQKDLWKRVEKMSKSALLVELKSMNKNVIVMHITDQNNRSKQIVATNVGIALPRFRKLIQNFFFTKNDVPSKETNHGLDKLVCEIFASNVNDKTLLDELEDIDCNDESCDETVIDFELLSTEQNEPVENSMASNLNIPVNKILSSSDMGFF